MPVKTQLSEPALEVLRSVTVVDERPHGVVVRLSTRHLPRSYHDAKARDRLRRDLYVEVDKVLRALGGRWATARSGHVFTNPEAVEEALDRVIHTGEVVDAKKLFQFYETPEKLADQLVKLANIKSGMRVLEPSAGSGRLVEAVLRVRGASAPLHVLMVEKNSRHEDCLLNLGAKFEDRGGSVAVLCMDFLNYGLSQGHFDRILMNPPFTAQQDAKHVLHAFDLLKPGGRLVAIMSAGVQFRTTDFYERVRKLASHIEPNAPDAFVESGTNVRTCTVIINK